MWCYTLYVLMFVICMYACTTVCMGASMKACIGPNKSPQVNLPDECRPDPTPQFIIKNADCSP